MSYDVKLSKQAVRTLRKLNDPILSQVKSKLNELKKYPDLDLDVKFMKGEYSGYSRIRIGKIRVIFYPDKKEKIIFIDAIGFRGKIYK